MLYASGPPPLRAPSGPEEGAFNRNAEVLFARASARPPPVAAFKSYHVSSDMEALISIKSPPMSSSVWPRSRAVSFSDRG
jgi:hypothetical protein